MTAKESSQCNTLLCDLIYLPKTIKNVKIKKKNSAHVTCRGENTAASPSIIQNMEGDSL